MLSDIVRETELALTLFDSIMPMTLKDGNSIAIKTTPTTDDNYRLNGGRTYVLGIQVLVRHNKWQTAWKTIQDIHDLWQFKRLPIDGLTNIQATTNPNFIDKTEHKEYEFTAIYNFEFER
jgi:hypothetical protein